MKQVSVLLAVLICTVAANAADSTVLQKAEAIAASQHRYILLNFSGSDWCVPCIKMRKSIFENPVFRQYQSEKLVWINADFPRSRKNLSKEQVMENEQLAEQYNKEGSFPFTLLLDEKGKVIKIWEGFPGISAEQFINEINNAIDDYIKPRSNDGAQKGAEVNGQPL